MLQLNLVHVGPVVVVLKFKKGLKSDFQGWLSVPDEGFTTRCWSTVIKTCNHSRVYRERCSKDTCEPMMSRVRGHLLPLMHTFEFDLILTFTKWRQGGALILTCASLAPGSCWFRGHFMSVVWRQPCFSGHRTPSTLWTPRRKCSE